MKSTNRNEASNGCRNFFFYLLTDLSSNHVQLMNSCFLFKLPRIAFKLPAMDEITTIEIIDAVYIWIVFEDKFQWKVWSEREREV